MFIKTVSTTSGINPIKFDETGGVFYWILNTGSSTVYASTKATFTAGDDGVVSLGPKESRRLETNNDTIYILGEGQVEIHNQRDGICSFKQAPTSSGSGGGGTIDAYTKTESDAKYAQKTDIPTSLPANGGNADTVDNKHATDFITGEVTRQLTTIDDCTISGAYAVSTVYTTDLPTEFGDWGIMDVRVYGLGIVQIIYFTGTKNIIHRSKIINQIEWTPWKEISTTPIKTDTITSNSDGAGYVWLPQGNGRKYISAITHTYTHTNMYIDGTTGSTNLQIPDAINSAVTIDIAWIE